jgi:hypothetical protein
MATVQLSKLDARLAYVAVQYHLSLPGSELPREAGELSAHGLGPVADAIQAQLDQAVVTIELSDQQRERLSSAIGGAINELKSAPLLAASGRETMVPAFQEALERLFPAAAADPDEATQLVRHLLALRVRLEQMEPHGAAETKPDRKSRWQFWRRN